MKRAEPAKRKKLLRELVSKEAVGSNLIKVEI